MEKVSAHLSRLQLLIPVGVGGVTYLIGEVGERVIAPGLTVLCSPSCMCANGVRSLLDSSPQPLPYDQLTWPGLLLRWRNAAA